MGNFVSSETPISYITYSCTGLESSFLGEITSVGRNLKALKGCIYMCNVEFV
jgi:hypothetical protein